MKNCNVKVLCLSALAVLAAPVGAKNLSFGTAKITNPSGVAEALFESPDTPAMVASMCMDLGWSVQESSSSLVVCETKPDGFLSFMQSLSKSRSQLRGFASFSIVKLGTTYRVQGRSFGQETNVFGQTRQVSGGTEADQLQEALLSIGGKRLPESTVSGVDLGIRGYIVGGWKENLWVLDTVAPGSIGERVGLKIGDRISRIGSYRIINETEPMLVQKSFGWMKKGAPATLTVLRGEEKLIIEIPELFRPK